jgi:transcriptional regulator with GAF, ATPase, and Fis domain
MCDVHYKGEELMNSVDQTLIGTSKCFVRATGMIPLLSAAKSTVLISGETGTGKELFARAIHYTSERRNKPFVPVNCAALPDNLIENELFGHTKGAFTGALDDKHGLFQEADGGTLFLDEINSLSVSVQSKLLRVLQDQEFRPLGATRSRKVSVKVIAATNTNLRHLVEVRQFREDLFHRLNVLSIVIPPLRDRREDILLLANHFVKVYAEEFSKCHMSLGCSCKLKLLGYSWPGNVRELEAVIQRAVAMAGSEVLESEDIDVPGADSCDASLELAAHAGISLDGSFQTLKAKVIDEFERTYLAELLSVHQGNISQAARAAKKERRAFQRLLHKHGLDRRGFLAA